MFCFKAGFIAVGEQEVGSVHDMSSWWNQASSSDILCAR